MTTSVPSPTTFALAQNTVSLASYAGLLLAFSPWAVAILIAAGLPAFIAETRFSGERFRAFQWRSPDRRMLAYLEIVLAREDHVKEVKLFDLGARLLARYREIFRRIYAEEKRLTIRRDGQAHQCKHSKANGTRGLQPGPAQRRKA